MGGAAERDQLRARRVNTHPTELRDQVYTVTHVITKRRRRFRCPGSSAAARTPAAAPGRAPPPAPTRRASPPARQSHAPAPSCPGCTRECSAGSRRSPDLGRAQPRRQPMAFGIINHSVALGLALATPEDANAQACMAPSSAPSPPCATSQRQSAPCPLCAALCRMLFPASFGVARSSLAAGWTVTIPHPIPVHVETPHRDRKNVRVKLMSACPSVESDPSRRSQAVIGTLPNPGRHCHSTLSLTVIPQGFTY